jgi:hypothetical protein
MENDDERYCEALELLRAALKICRRLTDSEIDRENVERLGNVVQEIEAAITLVEEDQRAIPLREG